jgi:3D (Asp-Asp-Asp) domain-containing protein
MKKNLKLFIILAFTAAFFALPIRNEGNHANFHSLDVLNHPANAAEKNIYGDNVKIMPGVYDVWVTAYSSSPEETDNSPFITASNKYVSDGFIATNFLPFGTKIKIPSIFGNKIFIVEDRMSEKRSNYIDVWMPSKEAALKFGVHRAKIIILDSSDITLK